jgi:hypothetical protein
VQAGLFLVAPQRAGYIGRVPAHFQG